MEVLSLDDVANAVRGSMAPGDKSIQVRGVSTDSRNIRKGDLFFALRGERYDGHQFIRQAMNAGARGAVVSHEMQREFGCMDFPLIRVRDVVKALGDLAKYYRRKLETKIIGITGSNGKTTTKEMTHHLLSYFGPAVKSQKSFNNFIGVPLTIFEIENRHRYGVLEMGTNAPGEIRRLSDIGAPDVAVIVNVSKTHLEGLGSIEGVALAKGEILENLGKDGVFVYNADNPWCVKISGGFGGDAVSFGFNPHARVRCTGVKKRDRGYVLIIDGNCEIYFPIPGYHNIYNCLASFAVCRALGHRISDLKDAFSSFALPHMRIEQQRMGNITLINDAYNANPASVRAALEYLNETDTARRKVFICGDMLELGEESLQLHREIGEIVAHLDIDLLWTVGERASEIAKAAKLSGMHEERISSFKDVADITVSDIQELRENDVVLIKGSRSMHMENLIEKCRELL